SVRGRRAGSGRRTNRESCPSLGTRRLPEHDRADRVDSDCPLAPAGTRRAAGRRPRRAGWRVDRRRPAPRRLGARAEGADPDRSGPCRADLRGALVTHDTIVVLAALGVAGQLLAALLLVIGLAWLVGARGPGAGA